MTNLYRVVGGVDNVGAATGQFFHSDTGNGWVTFFLDITNNDGDRSNEWSVSAADVEQIVPFVANDTVYPRVGNKRVANGGKPPVGSYVIGARRTEGDPEQTWHSWVLGRVVAHQANTRLPLQVALIDRHGNEADRPPAHLRCWYPLPVGYVGNTTVPLTVGQEFDAADLPVSLPVGTVFMGTVDGANRYVTAPGRFRDGEEGNEEADLADSGDLLVGRFRITHLPDDEEGKPKPDAEPEDLAAFKNRVWEVATRYGQENGHTGQIAQALRELGITGPAGPDAYEFDVILRYRVSAKRTTTDPIGDVTDYIYGTLGVRQRDHNLRMDERWVDPQIRYVEHGIENIQPI